MASMTYREHLEQFVAAVPTEVLSADIYPFYWVDGKKITLPGYMQGLSDLSEVAREHGQELCIVLQCLNNVPGYVRSVETAALRFQLYCAMAFGATWFFYWTYEAGYGVPEADGYLDHDGRPTPLYYRLSRSTARRSRCRMYCAVIAASVRSRSMSQWCRGTP